jgi:glycosyltransferase involved in cell wall biosynthesis
MRTWPDMPARSTTHAVIVPSYNTGPLLESTVRSVLAVWQPVWVVIDGSTDGSERPLIVLAREIPGLRVIVSRVNEGKGAAVLRGLEAASADGFTHALVMDSDGQHPVDHVERFIAASQRDPAAMILGRPWFGMDAPRVRLWGRQLSVAMARLEILGRGIADPLFGFRVYPIAPLLRVLQRTSGARHFDFDHEAAVRLFWSGVRPRNFPAPCRYLAREAGGVSHFHYVRDNVRLAWLHVRLVAEVLRRFPKILACRRRWAGDYDVPDESSSRRAVALHANANADAGS